MAQYLRQMRFGVGVFITLLSDSPRLYILDVLIERAHRHPNLVNCAIKLQLAHSLAIRLEVVLGRRNLTDYTRLIARNHRRNALHQITEVVAQTSSGARETTKAADQLSELASDLNAIVKQFKV